MPSQSKVFDHVWLYDTNTDFYECRICDLRSRWALSGGVRNTGLNVPECTEKRLVLSAAERELIEAITVAAYAGGTNRRPEDDVRWLLSLVDRLSA